MLEVSTVGWTRSKLEEQPKVMPGECRNQLSMALLVPVCYNAQIMHTCIWLPGNKRFQLSGWNSWKMVMLKLSWPVAEEHSSRSIAALVLALLQRLIDKEQEIQ